MRKNFVERHGKKIEQMDRSFDLKFWQAQNPTARFDASWELRFFWNFPPARSAERSRRSPMYLRGGGTDIWRVNRKSELIPTYIWR